MMFCTKCGAETQPEARFCPRCGAPAGGAESAPSWQAPPPPQDFTPLAGCNAQTGRWIGVAWTLVTGQLLTFALAALVMFVLSGVVPLVLQGPLQAGMYILCWRVLLGGRADVGDLFKGFNFFVPALIATIAIMALTFLGVFACIIGAFVVSAMYQFTFLFIVDRKLDFWPAMKASHAIVKQDYFGFTLFLLALALVHILGVLACFVGLLVTIPMQHMAITAAYKDLAGFASPAPPE